MVISADNYNRSFAALIYSNPLLRLPNIIHTPRIGFDLGGLDPERMSYADIGRALSLKNETLQEVNIFRIDGMHIWRITNVP